MASTCISNCVKDTRVPVRATYVNLYKWPESDVEFIRSLSSDKRKNNGGSDGGGGCGAHPKVVDSISCRQLYLRSYTFSRDDQTGNMDKEKKKAKKSSTTSRTRRRRRSKSRGITGFRRAKESSCNALAAIFRRLLYCTTQIDVVG